MSGAGSTGRATGLARLAPVLLLLACLPGAQPARAQDGEPAPRLAGVRFERNDSVSARTLRGYIDTEPRPRLRFWQERPPLDTALAESDAERLETFYRTRGHFEAEVQASFDWSEDRSEAVVVFRIDEGPAVHLADARIEVPPGFDEQALTADLPLEVGDVFTLDRYEAAKSTIQRRLADASHPSGEVVGGADVYLDTHEAKLTWRVEPGPLVRFGEVSIEGEQAVEPELIERRIEVEEGAPYSLDALDETREKLIGLGVYRSVVVQPQPADAVTEADGVQRWPVAVQLDPSPPRSVRLGVGWGTDDRWRGHVRWEHRNLFGGAEHFQARALYSSIEQSLRADLDVPDWLSPEQTLHAEAWLGQQDTVAYRSLRAVAGTAVQRELGRHWSARLGLRGSWSDVTHVDAAARRLLDDPERASVLVGPRLGVRHTTVEDLLDPQQGTWLDLEVGPSLPLFGSDATFVEAAVEGRAYRRVGPTLLAGRLRLASLEPFGGTRAGEIPMPARLYAGGGNSVRGFAFHGLGPEQADGEPIGGASLLEGSLELRFPIRGPLSGVGFVDAGQVDLEPHSWSPADLVVSVGAGLRYATPLGPVRVDVAFPLNAPDESETSYFTLSIGQAF